MQVDLLTKEDLKQFKAELLEQIGQLLAQSGAAGGQGKSQWLRSAQVRAMMSISPGTLQNLRINGTLRYRKVGGIMFYALSDIQAMMEGGASND